MIDITCLVTLCRTVKLETDYEQDSYKVVSIGLPSLYAQTEFSSHAQISLIVNVNSDITGQWFGLYLKMIVCCWLDFEGKKNGA